MVKETAVYPELTLTIAESGSDQDAAVRADLSIPGMDHIWYDSSADDFNC
jgi:hypothetical protein